MRDIIKLILLFLALRLEQSTSQYDDLFDVDADNIVENSLGMNIYQAKVDLHNKTNPFINNYTPHNDSKSNHDGYDSNPKYNKHKTYNTKNTLGKEYIRRQINFGNVSDEEIELQRTNMNLNYLFTQTRVKLPDFMMDGDELEQQTRRFDSLQDRKTMMKTPVYRRESYIYGDYRHPRWLRNQKEHIFAIMEQFLYEIRYRIPYVQVLRKKYSNSTTYKLGYLFSMVRTMKDQMQWLHDTMSRHYIRWGGRPNFHWYLKMYETFIRYEMDFHDLVKYIKKIEYNRMMTYDPTYYDYFPANF